MNEQKQSTLTSIEAYYDFLMKAASPEITMDSEIRAFLSKEGGIYKGGDDDMRAYYFYYEIFAPLVRTLALMAWNAIIIKGECIHRDSFIEIKNVAKEMVVGFWREKEKYSTAEIQIIEGIIRSDIFQGFVEECTAEFNQSL